MRRRQSNMAGPTTTGRLLSRRSPSAPWSGLPGLPIADAVMVADRADEVAAVMPRSAPVSPAAPMSDDHRAAAVVPMGAVLKRRAAVIVVTDGAVGLRQGG